MNDPAVLVAIVVCNTVLQLAGIIVSAVVVWQKSNNTEHKVDDVHATVNGTLSATTTALADANAHIAALSLQVPPITLPPTVTPTGAPAWPPTR